MEARGTQFDHLGKALALLRQIRGKSQRRVVRESGVGISQLSLYEGGGELPKLETLERLLRALDVSPLDFFVTVDLVTRRARDLFAQESSIPVTRSILTDEVKEAFHRTWEAVISLQALLSTRTSNQKIERGRTAYEDA